MKRPPVLGLWGGTGVFSEVHPFYENFKILYLYFNDNRTKLFYQLQRLDFSFALAFRNGKAFLQKTTSVQTHNWYLWALLSEELKIFLLQEICKCIWQSCAVMWPTFPRVVLNFYFRFFIKSFTFQVFLMSYLHQQMVNSLGTGMMSEPTLDCWCSKRNLAKSKRLVKMGCSRFDYGGLIWPTLDGGG